MIEDLKRILALLSGGLLIAAPLGLTAQDEVRTGMIENKTFDQRVHELLRFSVPTLSVAEAWEERSEYTFLDARQREEFEISRIPGAMYLGYRDPAWEVLKSIPDDQPIVLYCSVGYRSEKMAEELRKRGYKHVYNLYGSIFEWANQGHPLERLNGDTTMKLHTYSKKWSQYVSNPQIEKTW